MIGLRYCVGKHVEKSNDGANVLKWNLKFNYLMSNELFNNNNNKMTHNMKETDPCV